MDQRTRLLVILGSVLAVAMTVALMLVSPARVQGSPRAEYVAQTYSPSELTMPTDGEPSAEATTGSAPLIVPVGSPPAAPNAAPKVVPVAVPTAAVPAPVPIPQPPRQGSTGAVTGAAPKPRPTTVAAKATAPAPQIQEMPRPVWTHGDQFDRDQICRAKYNDSRAYAANTPAVGSTYTPRDEYPCVGPAPKPDESEE